MISRNDIKKCPGLQGWNSKDQVSIPYEIGIWGKKEDTDKDYSCIAASKGFSLTQEEYSQFFYSGDASFGSAFMWQGKYDGYRAAKLEQTRIQDSSGRASHRTTVIVFSDEPSQLPPALLAIAALKIFSLPVDEEDVRKNQFSGDPDDVHTVITNHDEKLLLDITDIYHALQTGFSYFIGKCSKEQLSDFLALLLDTGKLACCPEHKEIAPHEALPALLAVLPLEFSQTVSLISRVPSTGIDPDKFKSTWDGVLGDEIPDTSLQKVQPAINNEIKKQVKRTIAALFLDDSLREEKDEPLPGGKSDNPIKIALWGPPSSGKTVYLAQLFLNAGGRESMWEIMHISPQEKSRRYFEKQGDRITGKNFFPDATVPGDMDTLLFKITDKRTETVTEFQIEDHPGLKFDENKEETVTMLAESNGLLLLFDLSLPENKLQLKMRKTFDAIQRSIKQGRRLSFPLAICLTKIDSILQSRDDFEMAKMKPDEMVLNSIKDKNVIFWIERYFETFKLFPVSAIGVRVRRQLIESPVFVDNTLTQRLETSHEVETVNLIEPIAWILNQVNR